MTLHVYHLMIKVYSYDFINKQTTLRTVAYSIGLNASLLE